MSNLKHILPYGQDQMKEYQLCLDLPRGAVKKMWEGQDPFAPVNFIEHFFTSPKTLGNFSAPIVFG